MCVAVVKRGARGRLKARRKVRKRKRSLRPFNRQYKPRWLRVSPSLKNVIKMEIEFNLIPIIEEKSKTNEINFLIKKRNLYKLVDEWPEVSFMTGLKDWCGDEPDLPNCASCASCSASSFNVTRRRRGRRSRKLADCSVKCCWHSSLLFSLALLVISFPRRRASVRDTYFYQQRCNPPVSAAGSYVDRLSGRSHPLSYTMCARDIQC